MHGYIPRDERPQRPSGETIPVKRKSVPDFSAIDDGDPRPIPIVLNRRTLINLTIPTLIGVLAMGSTGIWFYYDTQAHKINPMIHLKIDERAKLETKAEAKVARKELVQKIGEVVELKQGKFEVRQDKRLNQLSDEMREQQRIEFTRIRQAIRGIGAR